MTQVANPVLSIVKSVYGPHEVLEFGYDGQRQTASYRPPGYRGLRIRQNGNGSSARPSKSGGVSNHVARRTRAPVLIVTNRNDSHADILVDYLDAMNVPVIRWHPDETPASAYSTSRTGHVTVAPSATFEREFSTDKVRSVWIRRPIVRRVAGNTPEERLNDRFEILENEALVQNVLSCIDAPFVNPLSAADKAHNKLLQLARAKSFFRVPEYVVSNQADVLREFASSHADSVIKPLNVVSAYLVEDGHALRSQTKTISLVQLDAFPDHLPAPAFIQRRIRSAADVRVTAIGQFQCAVRIETDAELQVDTRDQWATANHQLCETPHAVADGVSQYMTEFGLRYGAFDFVIDRNGEWWFLECNPSGQFLWLDDQAEVNLGQVMAQTLAGVRPFSCQRSV